MRTRPKSPRTKAAPRRLKTSEVKALVRYRDNYRCRNCGVTARECVHKHGKTLDVHRLTPGSRYTLKGCVSLCPACHGLAHAELGRPRRAEPRTEKVVTHLTVAERAALEEFRLDQDYQPDVAVVVREWIRQRLIEEGKLPARNADKTD